MSKYFYILWNFYIRFVFHWAQAADGMHQRTQNPVEMTKKKN